jgi:hypothetical protein
MNSVPPPLPLQSVLPSSHSLHFRFEPTLLNEAYEINVSVCESVCLAVYPPIFRFLCDPCL